MKMNESLMFEAFQHYESHPVDFCQEVVGVQLDTWQIEALNNLQEYHFLAIRSGSGVGKTCLMSLATIWFLATKPNCKIPTTAPSQHQLYDLLWSEHHKWISRTPFLQDLLVWTQTRIGVKGHEPVWYAVARTAQASPADEVASGLQGFHSEDNLLFLVDESSGVHDAIFPAMEGALTGKNAYALLAGNPTKTSGYFFDIFNNPKIGKLWKKMHVSCHDSPRVEKRYISMMEERYGEHHPIYLIKVLGDFATGSISTLIPFSYIEEMMNTLKDNSMSPKLSPQIGLDVGRSQSASVLTVRQGFNVLDVAEKHKPGRITDTEEICQWASEYITAYNPSHVKVDAIFNPGVFDMLKSMWGNIIVPVIGGQKSTHPERFINLRAEGYWDLRELIPKLWCKDWPQRLITELSDIRQKDNVRKDIIQIESKKDMMNRSMRSPDYADSLMYAFLSPEACLNERMLAPFTFASGYAAVNAELVKEDVGASWGFVKSPSTNRWKGLNA